MVDQDSFYNPSASNQPSAERAVSFDVVAPQSAEARACLAAYYQELAARFETGFDLVANPSPEADMSPPRGYFVLARLSGEAVGCGVLVCGADGVSGEIKRVWTAPAARGLGIAKRLLHRLEVIAGERGLEVLRLDTNRALREAQALYRREGYREIARFNDNPYAHHWFEKRLVPGSSS